MWECVKKKTQVIVTQDSAPYDAFLIGFGFIPSSSHSPLSNVVAKTKFKIAWGGRGGVTSFTYLTGKVPTLLTSIVGDTIFHKFNKLLPLLCYQCLNNFTHLCKHDSFFSSFKSSKPCSLCSLLLRPRCGRYGSHLGNLQKNRKQTKPLIRGQYKIHFYIYVFLRNQEQEVQRLLQS